MKAIFLDTNAYSFFVNGDPRISKIIDGADEVCLSVVTVGELYAGFRKGSRFQWNATVMRDFLAEEQVRIVDVTKDTAQLYGEITYGLVVRGVPIPTNDVWIAAGVVETGATLVTYDKHFLEIPGLKIWSSLS